MLTTDPKQALLARASTLVGKTAAAGVLWKYVDDEGGEFYLSVKKIGPMKSPFSGKTFTSKPEKSTVNDVSKDLKEEGAKVKGALFKYIDGEGKEFYLSKRQTSTLKSPFSGKSFTPKPEKSNLTEVKKELSEKKEATEAPSPDRNLIASEILDQGEDHPALKVLKAQYDAIVNGIKAASQHSARMAKVGVGRTEDPTYVLAHVLPEIKKLAREAAIVAQQMEKRVK